MDFPVMKASFFRRVSFPFSSGNNVDKKAKRMLRALLPAKTGKNYYR